MIYHIFIFSGVLSFKVFGPNIFQSGWLVFSLLNLKTSLYILDKSPFQGCLLQVFFPSLWLLFCELDEDDLFVFAP